MISSELIGFGWLILIPVLLSIVIWMFIRDLRRVRRREPIKFWFLDEIRPGDMLYDFAVFKIMLPYYGFFAFIVLLTVLISYAMYMGSRLH